MEFDPGLREKIGHALQSAKAAVECDSKQDFTNAIVSYKECIEILEINLDQLPEENHPKAKELINRYKSRIDLIDSVLGTTTIPKSTSSPIIPTNREFIFENAVGSLPESPPANLNFKPYWLMRILAKTIQSGGYLTPKIYITTSVWFQDGMKFAALNSKLENLSALNDQLLRIKDFSPDDPEGIKEFELLVPLLTHIQNNLSKHLYFISEHKDESFKEKKIHGFSHSLKKMVGRVRGREKLDETSTYVFLLLDVFGNSQFLEKWILYYFENQPASLITARLKRTSDFFSNVICAFVMKDLHSLVSRFMKNGKILFDKKDEKVSKKDKKDKDYKKHSSERPMETY